MLHNTRIPLCVYVTGEILLNLTPCDFGKHRDYKVIAVPRSELSETRKENQYALRGISLTLANQVDALDFECQLRIFAWLPLIQMIIEGINSEPCQLQIPGREKLYRSDLHLRIFIAVKIERLSLIRPQEIEEVFRNGREHIIHKA